MVTVALSDADLRRRAWSAAAQVVDPEIPVLTIADLGVLRSVERIDGRVVGRVWSFRDVSEEQRLRDELTRQAFHDALTDLPNRALLSERLTRQIAMADREKREIAVMFIDLDGFKQINDTHGHMVGDAVLTEVAKAIVKCTRNSDVVFRYGGEEFVVILSSADVAAADLIAHIEHAIRVCGEDQGLGDRDRTAKR